MKTAPLSELVFAVEKNALQDRTAYSEYVISSDPEMHNAQIIPKGILSGDITGRAHLRGKSDGRIPGKFLRLSIRIGSVIGFSMSYRVRH